MGNRRLARERNHQLRQHRRRAIPAIVAKLKLPKILRKMLRADMDMRAVDPALELRPEAFKCVRGRARLGANVFKRAVVHGFVPIAQRRNAAMRNPAMLTADECLVDLNRTAQPAKRIVAIDRAHVFADFVAHPPSRLVGDPKLALDFLGGDAVAARGEQEHDKEPVAQWGAGALERRPGHRRDLIAAMLARIHFAGADAIVARVLAALRTVGALAKADAHEMIEAGFLGRKLRLELAKGGGFRAHAHSIAEAIT